MFFGDKQDFDLWEVRLFGYMNLQGLKKTILSVSSLKTYPRDHAEKNEKAYSELVMLLDEKSLTDDGRMTLSILQDHYKGSSKPRILTLHTNMCHLKYKNKGDLAFVEFESKIKNYSENEKCRKSNVSRHSDVSDNVMKARATKISITQMLWM